MTVHREPAVGTEAILAAMNGGASWAGRDAGVAQHRHRLIFGESSFERAQLRVDVSKCAELGVYQRVISLAKAVQVEDEPAEVAVSQLARLA
jgi:hypothetical protein